MDGAFLLFALLALVVGYGGGFLIAQRLRGLGAFVVFLLWLAVPFVVLHFAFTAAVDPTLTAQQASYNVAMATVLTSIVIAIPWFGANLVGAIMGRNRRKPDPDTLPVAAAPDGVAPQPAREALPPADPSLPDWRDSDYPPLGIDQLGVLMRAIAARAGIDERRLPHLGPPPDREGRYLDRDKFDYIYIGLEHGEPLFDHRHVIADQTMYHVFRDVAADLAAEQSDPEQVAAEQQAILAGIDVRWGKQFALDRARPAVG
jgi:hypothetical protein